MNAKAYRPLVLKTLREANTNKPRNLEELADRIIDGMAVFDEMLTLAGGESAVINQPTPAYAPVQLGPAPQIDITERIVPKEQRVYSDEELDNLKTEAIAFYKLNLPKTVSVDSPQFERPLIVNFLQPQNSRSGMPFLGLIWGVPGAPQLTVQQDISGGRMTVDQVVAEVRKQAAGIYFGAPRAVPPRLPQPVDKEFSKGQAWGSADVERNVGL